VSSKFAIISLPDSDEYLVFDDVANDVNLCFHAISFDMKSSVKLYGTENKIEHYERLNLSLNTTDISSTSKEGFIDFIDKSKKEFQSSGLIKTVASRVSLVEKALVFNPFDFYRKLKSNFPAAYCSLFYDGESVWIGASPELLCSTDNHLLITESLAGTRLLSDNIPFSDKEKYEQKIVTIGIIQSLRNIDEHIEIKLSECVEKQTGLLKHLNTKIEANFTKDISVNEKCKALHPTPAIAGFPKEKAVDFILKNESHDRKYYAGMMGIESGNTSIYFVNIRCMQVYENKIVLYAGCGITADSDPEKEWEESENKIANLAKYI
jgi:isochorismate synthase